MLFKIKKNTLVFGIIYKHLIVRKIISSAYLCGMRIIATIPHPEMRISIFNMNQKYILKFEWGPLEQAYKWDEYDFTNLEDFISKINSSTLITSSLLRFKLMLPELNI